MSRGGLAAIVRALGGDLYGAGGRANVPGPGHSASDRSVSLMLSQGRVIAHSFAGDDWRAVLDDLFERGLVDRDGHLMGGGVVSAASGPSARERRAIAQGLWAEGRPI
ncbi:MAG: virulence-associated protein E, partial [Pseudomonadota bacterium]